jgi:thiosulfate reductase cytochrome b subunit
MSALYLYPRWLRVWHWINALLFLVLMYTGASMHFGGGGWLMPFDLAVTTHNTAGILLTLGWIGFVVGNLTTGNGRHYRMHFLGLRRAAVRSRGAITPMASSTTNRIPSMSAPR